MKYILFLILGITITVICLRNPTIEGASKKKKEEEEEEEKRRTTILCSRNWYNMGRPVSSRYENISRNHERRTGRR